MARLARIVVPGFAHHVTQRGNRNQQVFFAEEDYAAYLTLVSDACGDHGVRCLAWCLMPTQVQLILVPPVADGLRSALAEAHRRYSRRINAARDWTGYLWQGRFASYPMDDAHLAAAVRYVERGPVAAGLVAEVEDWPWSSARAHLRNARDGLTDMAALASVHRNWRAMLRHSADFSDVDSRAVAAIEAATRTGRPLGNGAFVEQLEAVSGRALQRRKPGPKPRLVTNP